VAAPQFPQDRESGDAEARGEDAREGGERWDSGRGVGTGMRRDGKEGRRRRMKMEVWDEDCVADRVKDITSLMERMFSPSLRVADGMREVVREAFTAVDSLYGEQEAAKWGERFEWEPEVFERDKRLAIESGYSLEVMARR